VGILAVLALVLVAGGYLLLRGPGSGLFDGTSGGADGSAAHRPARSHARPHHQQAHAVTHHHATFPALAPQTAGRVRGIVLQRIGGCTPGGTCGVQVSVRLAPAAVSQPVTWRVGVARRCVRNVLWSPATTVTAQPGWSRVFASSSVPIPTKARSLALVALTSAPTRAQSRPVPVPGATLQC
jgi:hypothetical protein